MTETNIGRAWCGSVRRIERNNSPRKRWLDGALDIECRVEKLSIRRRTREFGWITRTE
jgi:hypothetical protein